MTVASAPSPARTVVLLAEPGAGRARRLALALTGLGVAPPADDEAVPVADAAEEPAGGSEQAATENAPGETDGDDAETASAAPADVIVALNDSVLDAAGVRGDDARPRAWADVAAAVTPETEASVRAWVEHATASADAVLASERKLHWLLPVWVRACEEVGARAAVVLAVRRPDLSAEAQVGAPPAGRRGDIARAAAWLNQVLFTERSVRDLPVVVVTADEVADDWVAATARIGDALDLAAIRDAPAMAVRSTQRELDAASGAPGEPGHRVALPPRLRDQVDGVWALLTRLAEGSKDDELAEIRAGFDAARTAYVDYYAEAEGVARSSLRAVSGRPGAAAPTPEPAAASAAAAVPAEPAEPASAPAQPPERESAPRRSWWRR
ncbi:MAG TPA: hypothetical protein VFJ98_05890 [Mycobacteriales bacterium]|nr:hypothetical protein [Mycobacteriales bacterium]